ncbi:hypothetical protein LINPERHAP2_LOCUS19986 [Linum perenne]
MSLIHTDRLLIMEVRQRLEWLLGMIVAELLQLTPLI